MMGPISGKDRYTNKTRADVEFEDSESSTDINRQNQRHEFWTWRVR